MNAGAAGRAPRRLLRRYSGPDARFVAQALRTETIGGVLLLVAAAAAIIWANTPWEHGYQSMRHAVVGPGQLHLNLSLSHWASDGLLAIFFFVAGMELKREFVVGELRDRTKAVLPIAAAACGVALPALIFSGCALLFSDDRSVLRGWAIPTATDIAFALAVLAVLGRHLPSALRAFLLTLAVVDDLFAIAIIAAFYTDKVSILPLVAALIGLGLFWLLLRTAATAWLLVPVAVVVWALVHASGIHATVAGVSLGLLVPCLPDRNGASQAERYEHLIRPLSAGFAVPVFALFSAGVRFGGGNGITDAVKDPVTIGIVAGLILGKAIGVFGGTWLVARWTRAQLDEEITWVDVIGLALLSGIGFTVSLLIGELAYGDGSSRDDHVKLAVLAGSLLAAMFGAIVLRARNRRYSPVLRSENGTPPPQGSRESTGPEGTA